MIYTYKLPLKISKSPLYGEVEFVKGDKIQLALKFYDDSGNCLDVEGDISVSGYGGELLFKSEENVTRDNQGWYILNLNLNTVPLFDSTARKIKIVVRFLHEDKLRTLYFDAGIKSRLITGDEPPPELLTHKIKIKSPNGSLYLLFIDNDGNLQTILEN